MKTKILFVHEKKGFFGGAEQHIYWVAERLKEHFELTLLYEEETEKEPEAFDEVFNRTLTWEGNPIAQVHPDLIYVHKCLSPFLFEKIIESGMPTVHMVHDHEGYCLRGSKFFPLTKEICPHKAGFCCLFPGLAFLQRSKEGRLCFNWKNISKQKRLISLDKQCSSFFVASEYMKETLEIQGYPKDKIQVLFGIPSFPFERREKTGTIVYVGQITRGKGLDYLIKAMAKSKSNCHLNICGKGPFEDDCKKLTRTLGIRDRIKFHGFLPQQNVRQIVAEASVGVVPSVWPEPFGMSGVEMMQQGVPVIAFDSGGIREWIQDRVNGFLLPRKDVNALAEKIDILLQNPFGKDVRELTLKKFDFEKYITKLIETFQNIHNKNEDLGF